MTASFTKPFAMLTSKQPMSCMGMSACASVPAAMPSFYAFFASKVVGVVIAASILFSVGFRVLTPLAMILLAVLGQDKRRRTTAVCAVL